jgi:hypothetical protein
MMLVAAKWREFQAIGEAKESEQVIVKNFSPFCPKT